MLFIGLGISWGYFGTGKWKVLIAHLSRQSGTQFLEQNDTFQKGVIVFFFSVVLDTQKLVEIDVELRERPGQVLW